MDSQAFSMLLRSFLLRRFKVSKEGEIHSIYSLSSSNALRVRLLQVICAGTEY
jgi:hypothetical protein